MTTGARLEPVPDNTLRELSSQSRFAQRLRRRYASILSLLPSGTPTAAAMSATYETLRGQGHDTGTALRILRQLVMERLIVLD